MFSSKASISSTHLPSWKNKTYKSLSILVHQNAVVQNDKLQKEKSETTLYQSIVVHLFFNIILPKKTYSKHMLCKICRTKYTDSTVCTKSNNLVGMCTQISITEVLTLNFQTFIIQFSVFQYCIPNSAEEATTVWEDNKNFS